MRDQKLHENTSKPEAWNGTCQFLRSAFNDQDIKKLRLVVDNIQDVVSAGGMKCAFLSDIELEELLDTGRGMIAVGTGSLGQRIYIENGEIRMPIPDNDPYAGDTLKYHLNFKRLFDLPFDDSDPRKNF